MVIFVQYCAKKHILCGISKQESRAAARKLRDAAAAVIGLKFAMHSL